MGLETAQYVEDLNPLWPLSTDKKQEGDDQFRLLKSVLQNMTASQAQVTDKDNRVWLSAAALAMDIDFTGDITKSGEGFATLGANTFNATQNISNPSTASIMQLRSVAGQNATYETYENDVRRSIFAHVAASNWTQIGTYSAAGVETTRLTMSVDGNVNVALGQLQQGGVNVATLGANAFIGPQTISTTFPYLRIAETDQPVDGKRWRTFSTGGTFFIQTENDTESAFETLISATRTGIEIGTVLIGGNTINLTGSVANQVNGVEIATVDQISAMSYGGYSNIDATVTAIPEGWTITKAGVGLYTVTHNLGLLISDIFPTANAHSAQIYCTIDTFTANSFLVNTRNVNTAAFTDSAFSFNCTTL